MELFDPRGTTSVIGQLTVQLAKLITTAIRFHNSPLSVDSMPEDCCARAVESIRCCLCRVRLSTPLNDLQPHHSRACFFFMCFPHIAPTRSATSCSVGSTGWRRTTPLTRTQVLLSLVTGPLRVGVGLLVWRLWI